MRSLVLLLAFVAFGIGVHGRCVDLLQNRYEGGHRGACAALFSMLAKNHLRHGLLQTGGVPVLNPLKVDPEHFRYYLHHPPGAVLLATVGASLGGSNPIGLRLVFLPFALGIVLLIGRLARGRRPFQRATALGVAALAPVGVYYGAFVNFEVPTLFFLLLALHLYLRHLRRGRQKDLVRGCLAVAAAVACDWIALGFPLLLLVLAPLRQRVDPRPDRPAPRPFRTARLFLGAAIAMALLVRLQYWVQLQRHGAPMEDSSAGVLAYLVQATPLVRGFDFAAWGSALRQHMLTLFGLPVLLPAALGLLVALARAARGRADDVAVASLAMLGVGVANLVILAQHSIGHDYYVLYLLPAVALGTAISAGLLVGPLKGGNREPRAVLTVVLLVVLFVSLGRASYRLLDTRRQYVLSDIGEQIAAVTPETAVNFLAGQFTLQLPAQADRYVEPATSRGELSFAQTRALRFGMAGRPMIFLVPSESLRHLDPELRAHLDARGRSTIRGPFTTWDLGLLTP